jgi:hypothetical protein
VCAKPQIIHILGRTVRRTKDLQRKSRLEMVIHLFVVTFSHLVIMQYCKGTSQVSKCKNDKRRKK